MYGFRRGSGGAGGSGNVSTLSGGANGRITLWNGPTTVTGDASGTWSGTGHTFVVGSPTFNASDGHFTGPAGASVGPSSAGGGFTNQPAGDTVSFVSDDAGDTTQQVTIIGTLAGVDASENLLLDGVNPVTSVGTYDLILALVLNNACTGTITASETSGGLAITTIAPAALSAGLQTFGVIDGYGKVLQIVASGATTKTVGIGGYALGGGIQREPVVLTGTTKVNTTATWEGAVQFYLGDLEATRTVTLNSIAGFDFSPGLISIGTQQDTFISRASAGTLLVEDGSGNARDVQARTGTFGTSLIVGSEAALFNTYKGSNSDGLNLFIGGGGQSSVGAVGETYKGSQNTFLGIGSGTSNTTGYFNTFNGAYAGTSNTTGDYNTFSGTLAGYSNTTGDYNTFSGTLAGNANTTGSYNTFAGMQAGYLNVGTGNVGLGYSAGRYETGSNAFYVNNIDQTDTAGDKAYSLLYGTFAGSAGTRTGNMLRVNGAFEVAPLALTAGTMTVENVGEVRSVTSSYTWTNAQVVALGAALTGDIKVATLPAKTQLVDALVVITGQGAGTTTLTVACGRTGAGYIDYIVASDAKAAVNTVYGDASAERGTNLTGYDLPSYTGTTDIYCHFTSTVENLDQVTGSTGRVILTTRLLQ